MRYLPYRELVRDLTLPPRGPRGSKQNKRRRDIVTRAIKKMSREISLAKRMTG